MKGRVLYQGTNAIVRVDLEAGERVKAESDAMVSMSSTLDIEGKLEGGVLAGLGRMMAGEKFFFQTIHASRGAGHVLFAPSTPGDIVLLEMDGSTEYSVQKDGFLAGSDTIQVNTKMQNIFQGLFSGEGFFILKVSGKGLLALSAFGGIHAVDIGVGEECIIDNDHLVAWPTTTSYKIEKASKGWISSFTSGEGLVCRFTGPGKVYIQTRNAKSFASWVKQFIPASR
ncbi:MAG: TIGR00266 family protein [Candidatus Sericytochromatia bacterium]|nr:TIGR00266 family protein [Candidatus Sericytochromatia bacterium]